MGLKKKFYGNVERTFLVLNFLSYDLINRFVTPSSIRELYRSINKKNNEKTGYEKKLRLIIKEKIHLLIVLTLLLIESSSLAFIQ
jgi:hypothetical protein